MDKQCHMSNGTSYLTCGNTFNPKLMLRYKYFVVNTIKGDGACI